LRRVDKLSDDGGMMLNKILALALVAAGLAPVALAAPTVTLTPSDFEGAITLGSKHRGINVDALGADIYWDTAYAPNKNVWNWDTDATVLTALTSLTPGSVRLTGGTYSNYYDFNGNQSWIAWGVSSENQYNESGIPWSDWWTFYNTIAPNTSLVSTVNIFQKGSPEDASWVCLLAACMTSAPKMWSKYYKDTIVLPGTYFEMGNEVYGVGNLDVKDASGTVLRTVDSVSPMTYGGSTSQDYPLRACNGAARVRDGDSTAQVGLVMATYDTPWLTWNAFLNAVDTACGVNTFDFFIIHDYGPLVPQYDPAVSYPVYWSKGAERAVAEMDTTQDVADLRATIDARAAIAGRPIYVTETGIIYDASIWNNADSGWDGKGITITYANRWLDQVAEGANGTWLWSTFASDGGLVDVNAGTTTKLYEVVDRLFDIRGKLIRAGVAASPTFTVDYKIGMNCIEDAGSACWREVCDPATASCGSFDRVRVFAAYSSLLSTLTVIALNINDSTSSLIIDMTAFTTSTSVPFTRYQAGSSGWDLTLNTLYTTGHTYDALTHPAISLPPRNMTIYTFSL
jgi:hypothetical protein